MSIPKRTNKILRRRAVQFLLGGGIFGVIGVYVIANVDKINSAFDGISSFKPVDDGIDGIATNPVVRATNTSKPTSTSTPNPTSTATIEPTATMRYEITAGEMLATRRPLDYADFEEMVGRGMTKELPHPGKHPEEFKNSVQLIYRDLVGAGFKPNITVAGFTGAGFAGAIVKNDPSKPFPMAHIVEDDGPRPVVLGYVELNSGARVKTAMVTPKADEEVYRGMSINSNFDKSMNAARSGDYISCYGGGQTQDSSHPQIWNEMIGNRITMTLGDAIKFNDPEGDTVMAGVGIIRAIKG